MMNPILTPLDSCSCMTLSNASPTTIPFIGTQHSGVRGNHGPGSDDLGVATERKAWWFKK